MDVISEVYSFYQSYKGEKGYIGVTENKRLIPYLRVGTGKKVVLFQYAIHAREYITSYLAIEQIKHLLKNPPDASFYFVPMVNVDGVDIVLKGKPNYKANANGVDLNVNFDARWGSGVSNKRVKGESDYIGEYPFSESESRALRDFTYLLRPIATVSYHSKGREIYWYFHQKETHRDMAIAKALAKVTGYAVKNPQGSAGGYKDWCIEKLHVPSFTIEVGDDYLVHPIEKKHLDKIVKENLEVPMALLNELEKIYGK